MGDKVEHIFFDTVEKRIARVQSIEAEIKIYESEMKDLDIALKYANWNISSLEDRVIALKTLSDGARIEIDKIKALA